MATNLLINIVTEFLGKKAFGQADSATKKLTGSVKKLGGVLGVSLGAGAMLAYGKNAVKAFASAEAATTRLLSVVENLGLEFASNNITGFLDDISAKSGIAGEKLNAAFQPLLATTKSVTKSQELFRLALDIAAGSGVELATVTNDLARASVGSYKGLKKYSLGLTDAELKTTSLAKITALLNTQFSGSNATYLKTYAGQMQILTEASGNAQEIIGGALVDALKGLGDEKSVENLAKNMQNTAVYIGDVIRGVGVLADKLTSLPVIGGFKVEMIPIIGSYISMLAKAGSEAKGVGEALANSHLASLQRYATDRKADIAAKKRAAALLKIEQDKLKAANALAKAKKDQLALDKAALALGKGEDIFNREAVELNAALLAKQQEIEKLGGSATAAQKLQIANDLVRLSIKSDMLKLEDAIADKNVPLAQAIAARLTKELAILSTMQGQDFTLGQMNKLVDAIKPKDLINLGNLGTALTSLLALATTKITIPVTFVPTNKIPGGNDNKPLVPSFPTLPPGEEWPGFINIQPDSANTSSTNTGLTVVVNTGATLGTTETIVDAVQSAMQTISRRGGSSGFAGQIAL